MSTTPPLGSLPVGASADGDPFHVLAPRLNRHTFWCGQSGSGKTYALGVLLEQVLLNTGLPVLALDPNSDFVRLGEPRPDADPAAAERLRQREVAVLAPGAGDDGLKARFIDLAPATKAAVLRLDPVLDAKEYHALLATERARADHPLTGAEDLLARLAAHDEPEFRELGMRIENLQVLEWDLWAWGGSSVTDVIDRRPAATVLDLGKVRHREEGRVAALAVLEHLWERRAERRPVLIVIDEAHNICPATPDTAVATALVDQVVQIAAEGRKFGLWLLLSTQRPGKVHPNVVTQCDNLALLRMNSASDLGHLADIFGFAPGELVAQSPGFAQGQVLLAGGFVPSPEVVRVGPRVSHEGGSDVAVPLVAEDVPAPTTGS